jgi:fatty acyl-CoA reductase
MENVQEFYSGRSVFITGATGFMGKVLVEKLLRSCPGIDRLYFLIRPAPDKDAHTRLQESINCKVDCKMFSLSNNENMC